MNDDIDDDAYDEDDEDESTLEWDYYEGCACCYTLWKDTKSYDPCDLGDTNEPNPECAHFLNYTKNRMPPHHFSVRHPKGCDPSEITSDNEASVAVELGLDPYLDLSMACADFYILERLYHNSHDLTSRYVPESKRSVYVPALPMDFGKGTEAERLAYDIERTRESLNTELAKQLKTYMIMAVGGEARHAPRQAFKVRRRRGTPLKDWPKSKIRTPWKEFPVMTRQTDKPASFYRKYGCAACVEYIHSAVGKYKKMVYPCTRNDGNPATHANPECGFFGWWCELHDIHPGLTESTHYIPHSFRMKDYFESGASSRGERGLAWRTWLQAYAEHGPPLLQDCEEVFTKWQWVHGYGGSKWGEVAHFIWLFESGGMSAPAFLDRVWTLEHNGGNLFNKFYRLGQQELRRTLDIQAKDEQDYPELIKSASPYTQGLYRQCERLGILSRTPEIVWG